MSITATWNVSRKFILARSCRDTGDGMEIDGANNENDDQNKENEEGEVDENNNMEVCWDKSP